MAPRVPDEAAIGLTAVESPNGRVNGAPALHVEPSDAAIDGIDALLVRTSGVRRVCWLTPFQVCVLSFDFLNGRDESPFLASNVRCAAVGILRIPVQVCTSNMLTFSS